MPEYYLKAKEGFDIPEDFLQQHISSKGSLNLAECKKEIHTLRDALRAVGVTEFHANVTRDGLLGSLRRLLLGYSLANDYKKSSIEAAHDNRENGLLIFFQNAHAFNEIIGKIIDASKDEEFTTFAYDVRQLRNLFAHSYEKEDDGEVRLVRVNPNMPHRDDGLWALFAYKMNTSEIDFQVIFSIEMVLKEIFNLILKINKKPFIE